MDIISFNEAATANGRIESFIENPDSTSGIVTVPKVIEAGENVTIPAGRVAVLPNVQVDGTLNIDGEVFIPSGATFGDLESQIALKSDTSYVNGKYSGFKNYIINGNFDIWQRGGSQTDSGYGSDDRWFNINVGSTKIHSREVCTDTERALFNANYFSRTVVTSVAGAGSTVTKRTSIEDVTRLAGKTVTLSFWAKADSSKNIWVEFKQLFGTGGSPSSTVLGLYGQAISVTSTWQKKTVTLTLPSIIGKTLGTEGVHTSSTEVLFWFDVGSINLERIPTGVQQSGTFDIAQVQLEEGSIATPFENRPIGLELSLCQRYYQTWLGFLDTYNQTGQQVRIAVPFRVSMRAIPTIVIMSNTSIGMSSVGASISGNQEFVLTGISATSSHVTLSASGTASAEL